MRRSLALAIALVASLVAPLPAQATAEEFDPGDMVFPVGGNEYRMTDSFGDCRDGCSRPHEGVDIMAPKGTPVYAVADGVADWVSTGPDNCCRMEIEHGDGWVTRYIHLNDDTIDDNGDYTTDDAGWGIVEDIEDGTQIERGQLIGWVGDSGNAPEGVTHLHFELRKDGTAIDAYPYLLGAEGDYSDHFIDDDGNTHEENIDKLFEEGITYGCNPPDNDRYCPEREITRGEMAAFVTRMLGLTEGSGEHGFDDIAGSTFEADIDRIVTAGIGFGCDPPDDDSYCPDRPLLREEMAEMLVRAFEYDNPDDTDYFTDDGDSDFHDSINKLANHDVTVGCNPPDNDQFCPTRTLTRAEMASFFARALDL